MKRASILLAVLLVLAALPVLAAQPAASTQQPEPVTLEQILGGESGATDAVANWCYPSLHCSAHDDCDAYCGDPAFGYCEWNRCCSCLG